MCAVQGPYLLAFHKIWAIQVRTLPEEDGRCLNVEDMALPDARQIKAATAGARKPCLQSQQPTTTPTRYWLTRALSK